MKDRTKTNLLLVMAMALLSYTGFIQYNRLVDKRNKDVPKYLFCTYSSNITFKDDLALGMKAFIEYDGKRQRMLLEHQQEDSCNFSIPKEALKAGEFIVSAIDRDGNKSKSKKLYTLDGVVLENLPN